MRTVREWWGVQLEGDGGRNSIDGDGQGDAAVREPVISRVMLSWVMMVLLIGRQWSFRRHITTN